jgi:hypothetical protein
MQDLRPQMRPNLPNQAEIGAANGASGRIRFHLLYVPSRLFAAERNKNELQRWPIGQVGPLKGPVPKVTAEIACSDVNTTRVIVRIVQVDAQKGALYCRQQKIIEAANWRRQYSRDCAAVDQGQTAVTGVNCTGQPCAAGPCLHLETQPGGREP